jgi:putative ABC transport system permease protein
VLPALHVGRINLVESLTDDNNGSVGGKRHGLPLTRMAIMIGQIAIACVLLVGASLLSRSFIAMISADRGYDPTSLMTATIPMPQAAFPPQRKVAALDRIVERVRALPKVTHVAYTDGLPLSSSETLSAFTMSDTQDRCDHVDDEDDQMTHVEC